MCFRGCAQRLCVCFRGCAQRQCSKACSVRVFQHFNKCNILAMK
ncbi:hypothetical protein A2U01_0090048, partial [Trifolium medium]|nr:hypothetical protein [Trifolium medium]